MPCTGRIMKTSIWSTVQVCNGCVFSFSFMNEEL